MKKESAEALKATAKLLKAEVTYQASLKEHTKACKKAQAVAWRGVEKARKQDFENVTRVYEEAHAAFEPSEVGVPAKDIESDLKLMTKKAAAFEKRLEEARKTDVKLLAAMKRDAEELKARLRREAEESKVIHAPTPLPFVTPEEEHPDAVLQADTKPVAEEPDEKPVDPMTNMSA